MARLSDAEVYCKIGLPFEKRLLKKVTGVARRLIVIDTARGIALRRAEGHEDHGHAHSMLDPHIWLAPQLIKIQAATIAEALCAHDPANAGAFRADLQAFQSELDLLDADIREKLAPFAGREIFVFHPAFGYYTDAYGLRQIAIETDGKEPGSRSLAAVVDRAKSAGVKVIFAEQQFSPKTAAAVARQVGAEVITLDPLGHDCFQNLRFITDRIVYALSK
jgi:zinc transport system substrate-binding protein